MGVHRKYLPRYRAAYEAIVNNKRITAKTFQGMCCHLQSMHSD